jgi:hypothetical protein
MQIKKKKISSVQDGRRQCTGKGETAMDKKELTSRS